MHYKELPTDPAILLSFVNTQLRDHFNSLDELCMTFDADKENITSKLSNMNYIYDVSQNQFI